MFKSLIHFGVVAVALSAPFLPLSATGAFAGPSGANVAVSTNCAIPDAPAAVSFAAIAEAPVIANRLHLTGTTLVQVDVDADGSIHNLAVYKSSGSPLLDNAAMRDTRVSAFKPEIRDCVPVGGTYLYQVDFQD